jgi:uncharacterized protein YbjT (DUF2867 family)
VLSLSENISLPLYSIITKVDSATPVFLLRCNFASIKNRDMKIVLTGSLGHISKPLTTELVEKGHSVTVISSNPEKQEDIERIGANASIGSIENPGFLTQIFTGADIVYCMEPPVSFFNPTLDYIDFYNKLARSYVQAIKESGVKQVVHLSSIGAHTDTGNGMLRFHYNVEQIMKQLQSDVHITFMRPVGFYYNLLNFINGIKTQGAIVSNYGGGNKNPWVSPIDIASAIVEEMEMPFEGRKVRYVASEEISCDEIARILGSAIGKPDLQWIVIPDEQLLEGVKAIGMHPTMAVGFVEMNASIHRGVLFEDYFRNRPVLGNVKMVDFAKEFSIAYHSSVNSNH